MVRPRTTAALRATFACLLLAGAGPAAGAWYHVEVIVFRAFGATGADSERWPSNPGTPDLHRTVDLIDPSLAFADEPPAAVAPAGSVESAAGDEPVAFQRLASGEMRLGAIARQLERSGRYDVLTHAAWRQPGLAGPSARAVNLGPPPPAQPGNPAALPVAPTVQGWVRVQSRGAMLLDADLLFDNDGVPVRLAESRKVRLGELHYLDHPLYGVLVQVTAWRTEDELEAAREAPDAVPPPAPAAVMVPGRTASAPSGPPPPGPRASAPAPDLPALPAGPMPD